MLKKKCVFLGFEDVLVPGVVEKDFALGPSRTILKKLMALEQKEPGFRFFVLTGLTRAQALEARNKHVPRALPEDKLFAVTDAYVNSKADVDKALYERHKKEHPRFKDEYFKQVTIQKILSEYRYRKEDALYIGHDVWTEGFYTRRFSQIDFAIIESARSHAEKPKDAKIKGLCYLKRKWPAIEGLLYGETALGEYAAFDRYVYETIRDTLFEGTKLGGLAKLAR